MLECASWGCMAVCVQQPSSVADRRKACALFFHILQKLLIFQLKSDFFIFISVTEMHRSMKSCLILHVPSSCRQWFLIMIMFTQTITRNRISNSWKYFWMRFSSKLSCPLSVGKSHLQTMPNRYVLSVSCSIIIYHFLASSFLKLYTTMPVAKLAGFLDLPEQEFRIQLLVFKHKMKNLVWTSGISALEGEFQSASEVDFYIDKVITVYVAG